MGKSDLSEVLIAEMLFLEYETRAICYWNRLFKLRPDLIFTDKDKELLDKKGKEWEDFLPFLKSNSAVVVKPLRPGRKRKSTTFNDSIIEQEKKNAGISSDGEWAKETAKSNRRSSEFTKIKTAIKHWKDQGRRTESVFMDQALELLQRKSKAAVGYTLVGLISTKEEELKRQEDIKRELAGEFKSLTRLKMDYLKKCCLSIGALNFINTRLPGKSSNPEGSLGLKLGFPIWSDSMEDWIVVGRQMPDFSERLFVDAWNCLFEELFKPLSSELGEPTWWYVI